MSLLAGRTAVVTGAARGIGLSIARAFLTHGANVVLADVNLDAVRSAAGQFAPERAFPQGCDVTVEEQASATVDAAMQRFGGLDIMVNNAGVTRDALMRKMTLNDFRLVLDVHLTGIWLGIRAAAALMRERGAGGSIINMSSISGKAGNRGQTNYSAAKAGIVGMTKAAAKEVAHAGIRVNAIQPGLIRTAMTEAMRPDVREAKLAEIPLGRTGEPAEVAGAAVFLASGLSSYMTGAVLEVTGGRYM